jgi:sugar-specific transcriptional regulator TrmB
MVKRLTQFGFTTNQAKVYLSIIQAGSISAGKIAKLTLLHRQDIYKILPKLEKKGLITKTISKPFKIHAVPLETALYQLVLNEKEKANKKINDLECNVKNLVESLKEPQEKEEDTKFTLLTTDESIGNTINQTISSVKKEIKIVADTDILLSPLSRFIHETVDTAFKRKIKINALIETSSENIETVAKIFEKLNFNKTQVVTKGILENTMKHYVILDDKEVWIATEQKTESGIPNILWTNDNNIVQVYLEYFDKGWNDSKSATVFPVKEGQKKRDIVIA